MGQPYLVQENFRIGQPDGSESAHTFYADINTGVNIGPGQTVDDGEYIFLRFGFANTGDKVAIASQFPVEIAYNGGTYANIGSTGAIKYATHATYLTHGNDTTDRLGGTGTFDTSNFGVIEGTYQQSSSNTLGVGERQEIVIVLQVDQSQMSTNGDYYDIRVSGMNSWTNTPRFTVAGLTPPPGDTVSSSALLMTTDGYIGSHSGPFIDGNGNLYLILIDDTNEYTLRAFKSTDNGETWAEQDSSNRPTTDSTSAVAGYDVKKDGDTLHIATMNDGATCYIYYHTFQMSDHTSADQWGTTDQTVYSGITDTTGEFGCYIGVQADGDIIIVTAGDQIGGSYESVRYHYNIGAGWVTNNTLLGTNFDNVTGSAGSGIAINTNDDSIGIIAKEESNRDYTFWELADPDSTPGSGTEVFSTLTMTGFNYVATSLRYYRDGSNDKYAFVSQNSSEASYLQIITNGTPGTPVSTGITVWDSTQHRVAHEIFVYGTDIYYLYAKSDGDLYYKVSANGAAFGSENTLASGITAPLISAEMYVRSGNLWIGVAWENNVSGDVLYYAYDLGAVSTTHYGSAALTADATISATGSQDIDGAGALTADATVDGTGIVVDLGNASLDASASVSGTGSVAVYGGAPLSASATLDGTGSTSIEGAASLSASATISATGSYDIEADANLTGTSTVTGSGTAVSLGNADLDGTATVGGAGTVVDLGDAALDGTATIAGTGSTSIDGNAALDGTATVTGTGSYDIEADADLAGAASVFADGSVDVQASASLDGTASVSATGSYDIEADASLSSSATITGAGTVVDLGDASLSATATVSGTGSTSIDGNATLSATAIVVGTGSYDIEADASLSASATVASTGSVDVFGSSALSASASVVGTGLVEGGVYGDAALSADATVVATGYNSIPGDAGLSSNAVVNATGSLDVQADATLNASAVVTGTGVISGDVSGNAELSSSATISASGEIDVYGESALSASGSVSATATVTVVGSSGLSGSSTISGSGTVVKIGASSLSGGAQISASSHVDIVATADLGSSGTLSGSATLSIYGAVSLSGVAVVAGTGQIVTIEPEIFEYAVYTRYLLEEVVYTRYLLEESVFTAYAKEIDVEI